MNRNLSIRRIIKECLVVSVNAKGFLTQTNSPRVSKIVIDISLVDKENVWRWI